MQGAGQERMLAFSCLLSCCLLMGCGEEDNNVSGRRVQTGMEGVSGWLWVQ